MAHSRGREFQVQGHTAENRSGLVGIGVVVGRGESDDVLIAAKKHGLQLFAEFDDTEPTLALLEAIGEVNFIEQFAKDLVVLGFQRLTETTIRLADLPDMLTDEDMAGYLGKSLGAIQRMRLHGGMPYLPGRPPLVSKQDFLDHLERLRVIKEAKAPKPRTPFWEMTPGEQVANARARALKMKHKPVRRPRPSS